MPHLSYMQHSTAKVLAESRVLIVDDVETSRIILCSFCKKAGIHNIKQATNGEQALAIIEEWKPDLVLLDIEMPVMDGITLCRLLKDRGLLEDTMVIIQTGNEKAEAKALVFEAGATDLITKPLVARETIARITSHLERRLLSVSREAELRRIQEELREAVILQNVLLPADDLLDNMRLSQGVDIAYYYHPASELGGDYISTRALSSGHIAISATDVSGHGITAALYAFAIYAMLESALKNNAKPNDILSSLNLRLHSLMREGMFATMFLGIIDTQNNQLTYSAAASPPAILIRKGTSSLLPTRGYLLGAFNDATFTTHTVPFSAGDMLFIYSDALIETPCKSGNLLTPADLATQLETQSNNCSTDIVRHLRKYFYDAVRSKPIDDVTMLACKR